MLAFESASDKAHWFGSDEEAVATKALGEQDAEGGIYFDTG